MSRHEISAEETIDAPPAKVYEVLAATERVGEWMPNVADVKVSNAKKGVGATRHIQMQMGNMTISSEQKVDVAEPGKKFGWVHVKDTLDGQPFDMLEDVGTFFVLAAKGKGTHVTATAHFVPKGIKAKLAAPLFTKDVKKQVQTALVNLKRIVERR